MKTNYLKISMLAAVIALSSCSKDDEPATSTEVAVVYDAPVALEIEASADISVNNTTTTNTMVDFGGALDNFTIPAFRTDAEGDVNGPTICDVTPTATFDKKALTYTFKYDFPTNGTCSFEGRKIAGDLYIVIDVKKDITFKFTNFSVTEQLFPTVSATSIYNGNSVIAAGSTNAKRTFKFNNLKNKSSISHNGEPIISIAVTRNGEMTVATEGNIRTVSGTLSDAYDNILYKVTLDKLKTNTTCPKSGFLSGSIKIENTLNTIVSTYNSTCEVKKMTVKNNGKEKNIE